MQAMMAERIKRVRAKRDTSAITYRLLKPVKESVTEMALESGKSENKQAEYLLMVGILTIKGFVLNDLSDLAVMQKFNDAIATATGGSEA
jgi:uncharacterized membrane protein YdfJ with MMPL/SSD domain